MTIGKDSHPWIADEAGPEAKKHAPAAARNRVPIIAVLRDVLPKTGTVLEVASGSGEHAIAFAEAFPGLRWIASDPDPACRASIAAWTAESDLANIAPPLDLDATASDWPINNADALLCINMIHISPWSATLGLMAGASRILAAGAPLFLYGPYRREDAPTAPSNVEFDRSLKGRNPDWGLRNLGDVIAAAADEGLRFDRLIEMPANNLSVVFRKNQSNSESCT